MITCKTFLSSAATKSFWEQGRVFCFVGNECPHGFFSALMLYLKKNDCFPSSYQRLFFDDQEAHVIGQHLSQSILGSTSFFWLGDVSVTKPSKQEQRLLDFMMNYSGPHTIAFFLSSSVGTKPPQGPGKVVIQLEEAISASDALHAVAAMGISLDTQKRAIFTSFFSKTKTLSLDAVCRLAMHLDVISLKSLETDPGYIERLIDSPQTLTVLAQYFFAKQAGAFFKIWKAMKPQYPDVFWFTFWSEQLWRASSVIWYMEQKQFASVKRSSFRLPYSFINLDWKKTSPQELAKAYTFLYSLDFALKTSTSSDALELFFLNYFLGKFS